MSYSFLAPPKGKLLAPKHGAFITNLTINVVINGRLTQVAF